MDKLKPCPFCGEAPMVYLTPEANSNYFDGKGRLRGKRITHIIKCAKCMTQSGEYENPVDAIEAWNRRVYEKRDQRV